MSDSTPAPGPGASEGAGLRLSPLDDLHRAAGAQMTEFAGWSMPLRFGSDLEEHRAVRTAAGMFDLSHMGQLSVQGPGAAEFLDYALCSRFSNLAVHRARYTMLTTPAGGVLDDLVVYHTKTDTYVVVANAANADVVARELSKRAQDCGGVEVRTQDTSSLIAIQGPAAAGIVERCVTTDMPLRDVRPFGCIPAALRGQEVLLARTGYTGEDGFEVFVPAGRAAEVWATLLAAGSGDHLLPCGLAARDTLRLEAAMPLYGHELTQETTPFDAGWGRIVALTKEHEWVGRAALIAASQQPGPRTLIGLTGQGRRAARQGCPVLDQAGHVAGEVTSGVLSPTLGYPIALAYVTRHALDLTPGTQLHVDVRGHAMPMTVAETPFYRRAR